MNKAIFLQKEKVYHYTAFVSALKILSSNKLLFGELQTMNDVHEVYHRKCYAEGVKVADIDKALSRYRQISFTRDKSPRDGYDIPAMWGHYAEKGYGICLVFDKEKLMHQLKECMITLDVVYEDTVDENIYVEQQDVQAFFRENQKEIFGIKTKDWAYEQEWRIIAWANQEERLSLSIKDSLMAVIMNFAPDVDLDGCVFNSVNAELLRKVAPDIPILSYGFWSGRANLSDKDADEWNEDRLKGWDLDLDDGFSSSSERCRDIQHENLL